ncbi:MAG: hypothetical protein ICV57_04345 [Rubrobacter sp.]|nr:hypothetical protein [Rubrobacter sp.]
MGFEESALERLRRYRKEADLSLGLAREAEERARRFSERLFAGLEYTAALAREAGFESESAHERGAFALRVCASPGSKAQATFGLVGGAAAETDEDLVHEDLSSYSLDPSGYSGRILGFSEQVGEDPCQVFAIYRDGVWRTKGLFVERARGGVDDPDEVLNGFCLRILGRLIDLSVPTRGAGRRWAERPYALVDLMEGRGFPTETRWFK